jgi:predicted dehydrogenase
MQGHINNMLSIPDAEIVAMCDNDPKRIGGTKTRWPKLANLPEFDDYRKMLKRVEMDATIIATPHTLHFQELMDSMAKGLHVLCEKPMTCTIAHAKKVVETAKKTKKVITLSYQRHYQGQFRFIKKLIAEKTMGEIEFVQALQCQEWKKGTKGSWRQDPKLSGGGQINDSGSHLLNIIMWVTGLKVTEVAAFMDNCGTPVDINSAISIQFNNGAKGNISIMGNSPMWWEDLTFTFTDGMILYRNGQLSYKTGLRGEVHHVDSFPNFGSPDHNFIGAVLGREENMSPPIDGLRVIELTEAAWRSAAAGGKVFKVR